MEIEFIKEHPYQSILKRERENIDSYLKNHYGDSGMVNYLSVYGNIQMLGEMQKSSQQFQYRKQLMSRLFDEALPLIASETRYGLAFNKEEQVLKVKEKFKHMANDYWIFKKLIQLRNWDYASFLHVIDLYVLAHLYLNTTNINNSQDFSKAALIINLGRIYIPKNILQKKVRSKREKNIVDHHSLWSMEIIKDKVSINIQQVVYHHYQYLFNLPVEEENEEVQLFSKILTVLDQYSELTLLGKDRMVYPSAHAISLLETQCKQMGALFIWRKLMGVLNIYPEKTLVALTNGSKALVQETTQDAPFLPRVKECQSGEEYNLPLDQSVMIKYPYHQETKELIDYYTFPDDLTQYAYQLFDQKCRGKDINQVYREVVMPSLQQLLRKKRSPEFIEKLFLKWMWEEHANTII